MIEITLGNEKRTADDFTHAMKVAEEMHSANPSAGVPTFKDVGTAPKQNSTFGANGLVTDAAAKTRIEGQHAALTAAGVKINEKEQFYATGTRMADVGYTTQEARKAEFLTQSPIREVAAKLIETVKKEQRTDFKITAGALAEKLALDAKGRVSFDGYRFGEFALRGMMPRVKSGSLSYLLSLRDRIDGNAGNPDARAADNAMIADVLKRELRANPEIELKLRLRQGRGDCFAVVSPSYAVADAPEALKQIADALPKDARGNFSYDPRTTAWQLRADVWTPTDVAEQAVGEAFQGYAALGGRDGGNGSVYGRGGALFIRCLNASTYSAEVENAKRVHRGQVLLDVGMLFKNATRAIEALCKVWGIARTIELPEQPTVEGVKLAREIALAGYFRGMLSDKRSEMAGVLPGRTENHVKQLVTVYASERRNGKTLVKSDLANAVTRYAQNFGANVQRDTEGSIGNWLASGGKIVCDARVEA